MLHAHRQLSLAVLQDRLIEHIRGLIRNGEATERRLARLTGISQPHIHHLLKGVRSMKPEVADLLLGSLGLSALDLVTADEAAALLEARQRSPSARSLLAPVASGPLGPGEPFPAFTEAEQWVQLPEAVWEGRGRLAAARLAPDPASPAAAEHDFAVLCLDEEARLRASSRHVCVLRWRGAGYLRRVRIEPEAVFVLAPAGQEEADGPRRIALAGQSPLALIRAIVLWTGADFRTASPLDYMGCFLESPASR